MVWGGPMRLALVEVVLLQAMMMYARANTCPNININSGQPLSIQAGGQGSGTNAVWVLVNPDGQISINTDGSSSCLGQQCALKARNCLEVQQLQGHSVSGVYSITPYECCRERVVQVYCDMDTDEGGWTVVQRRDKYATQEDFYRSWTHYVRGFGDLSREFWLGLDHLHALTNQKNTTYEARFDLGDFDNASRWAQYDSIRVGDAESSYKLELGQYSGDAGNAMDHHTGRKFSTYDKDNDDHSSNCASTYKGAWWYGSCHNSNLNGVYYPEGTTGEAAQGIIWQYWRGDGYSLKSTEIKIRPKKLIKPCQC